jgi:hypothetical protein
MPHSLAECARVPDQLVLQVEYRHFGNVAGGTRRITLDVMPHGGRVGVRRGEEGRRGDDQIVFPYRD